ncbi:MAG: carboxylating nicotinate-nucleotide diphosphorylase, partial [Nocardioidaceae bacterium]
EVACSGVHGANRLASNSLLEGLVFAGRIAADLGRGLPQRRTPGLDRRVAGAASADVVGRLQQTMAEHAGVLRTASGLDTAGEALARMTAETADAPGVEAWEATNLLTVAVALVQAAALREETRGSHWRDDYPIRDDEHWLGSLRGEGPLHLDSTRVSAGERFTMGTDPHRAERWRVDAAEVRRLVAAALTEDTAGGVDVTSAATVPDDSVSWGDFVVRAEGVLAGLDVAEEVMRQLVGDGLTVERPYIDGAAVAPGDVVMSVRGPTRALLTGERTALNLLCHLSGVATVTRQWADAIAATPARVRDTRKTTPMLRSLEKYAVRCGGGVNHRMSLSDEALVKDNHVIAAGGVTAAYRRVRESFPTVGIQVEVDTLEQALEAVNAGAELLLLDNMPAAELAEVVHKVGGRATLEASGGLTKDSAREVAETGVDYLAVGALTHSAPALDIALDLRR